MSWYHNDNACQYIAFLSTAKQLKSTYPEGTISPGMYDSPPETGLYYLNSRYYSPEFGRFISADVYISTGQGLQGSNMFAYCGNDPVNRADEDGQIAHIVVEAAIGAFVGALVGGVSAAVNDNIMGSEFSWGSVFKGAAVGAINGVIMAVVPSKLVSTLTIATVAGLSEFISGSSLVKSLFVASTAVFAAGASKAVSDLVETETSMIMTAVEKTIASFAPSICCEGSSSVIRAIYVGLTNNPSRSSASRIILSHGGVANTLMLR